MSPARGGDTTGVTCPVCGERFDPDSADRGLLFRALICPTCHEAFPPPTD